MRIEEPDAMLQLRARPLCGGDAVGQPALQLSELGRAPILQSEDRSQLRSMGGGTKAQQVPFELQVNGTPCSSARGTRGNSSEGGSVLRDPGIRIVVWLGVFFEAGLDVEGGQHCRLQQAEADHQRCLRQKATLGLLGQHGELRPIVGGKGPNQHVLGVQGQFVVAEALRQAQELNPKPLGGDRVVHVGVVAGPRLLQVLLDVQEARPSYDDVQRDIAQVQLVMRPDAPRFAPPQNA
mmetsp:Transcript_95124/g.273899  ORF Transcript_95124/g.273899 Transcript_95124/m.273899 type:complete len:237 (+) Transcript_95124:366-1076(+)